MTALFRLLTTALPDFRLRELKGRAGVLARTILPGAFIARRLNHHFSTSSIGQHRQFFCRGGINLEQILFRFSEQALGR